MSTATIALTAEEAEVIARAKAVLARAESPDFPYPWLAKRSDNVQVCLAGLRDSIAEHDGLISGSRHPESVFHELGRHQDNAAELALEWVTEDIAYNTGAFVIAVGDACGDKAAAFVSGEEGGGS